MTNFSAFWDRIAQKYARDPIEDPEAYDYTCQRSTSYLGPNIRALEIGCGTGTTALRLGETDAIFHASDISAEMIKIANERKAKAKNADNVTFRVAEARTSVGDADANYDVIFAHSLLHLVPDPEHLIAAVAQKLDCGGYFISKTPCLGEPGMGLKGLMITLAIPVMSLFGKAPKIVQKFSSNRLETMVRAQGFDIVESGDYPSGSPPSRYIVARKTSTIDDCVDAA